MRTMPGRRACAARVYMVHWASQRELQRHGIGPLAAFTIRFELRQFGSSAESLAVCVLIVSDEVSDQVGVGCLPHTHAWGGGDGGNAIGRLA